MEIHFCISFLIFIFELAQKEIEGIKLKDNLRKIAPTNFGREITMPVSDILKDEQDKHYTIAKAAFRSLSEKHIEYEDDEVWSYTPIITAPEIKKNSGSVKFYVFDNIWRCLLDFTKGFKKYELITAMKFKSAYAMRFYELMSGQTKPLFVLLGVSPTFTTNVTLRLYFYRNIHKLNL